MVWPLTTVASPLSNWLHTQHIPSGTENGDASPAPSPSPPAAAEVDESAGKDPWSDDGKEDAVAAGEAGLEGVVGVAWVGFEVEGVVGVAELCWAAAKAKAESPVGMMRSAGSGAGFAFSATVRR